MSIQEIIDKFDSLRANTISLDTKLQWIEDFESLVSKNVLNKYFDTQPRKLSVDSLSNELLIQPPFQRLYILYMLAMLSFDIDSNDEYNAYVDSYNYEMACFMRYIARNNIVVDSSGIIYK